MSLSGNSALSSSFAAGAPGCRRRHSFPRFVARRHRRPPPSAEVGWDFCFGEDVRVAAVAAFNEKSAIIIDADERAGLGFLFVRIDGELGVEFGESALTAVSRSRSSSSSSSSAMHSSSSSSSASFDLFLFLVRESGRYRGYRTEFATVVPGKIDGALNPGPAFRADFSASAASFSETSRSTRATSRRYPSSSRKTDHARLRRRPRDRHRCR